MIRNRLVRSLSSRLDELDLAQLGHRIDALAGQHAPQRLDLIDRRRIKPEVRESARRVGARAAVPAISRHGDAFAVILGGDQEGQADQDAIPLEAIDRQDTDHLERHMGILGIVVARPAEPAVDERAGRILTLDRCQRSLAALEAKCRIGAQNPVEYDLEGPVVSKSSVFREPLVALHRVPCLHERRNLARHQRLPYVLNFLAGQPSRVVKARHSPSFRLLCRYISAGIGELLGREANASWHPTPRWCFGRPTRSSPQTGIPARERR